MTPPAPQPKLKGCYQPFSGYTESWLKRTGTLETWAQARDLSRPDFAVLAPQEWNADPKKVASLICNYTERDAPIVVSGYSWGGGWGAIRLAEKLNERGRRIVVLVLVDPVYRLRWTPTKPLPLAGLTNPTSMLGRTKWARSWFKIKVPPNVDRVVYFRQKNSRPAGREVVAEDPEFTKIEDAIWIPDANHVTIDNHPEVRRVIYDEVQAVVEETK